MTESLQGRINAATYRLPGWKIYTCPINLNEGQKPRLPAKNGLEPLATIHIRAKKYKPPKTAAAAYLNENITTAGRCPARRAGTS